MTATYNLSYCRQTKLAHLDAFLDAQGIHLDLYDSPENLELLQKSAGSQATGTITLTAQGGNVEIDSGNAGIVRAFLTEIQYYDLMLKRATAAADPESWRAS